MASQDDLALLKQMYERGEISDEQYDTLRRHVLWGTPLPSLVDEDPAEEPPTQTWTPPADWSTPPPTPAGTIGHDALTRPRRPAPDPPPGPDPRTRDPRTAGPDPADRRRGAYDPAARTAPRTAGPDPADRRRADRPDPRTADPRTAGPDPADRWRRADDPAARGVDPRTAGPDAADGWRRADDPAARGVDPRTAGADPAGRRRRADGPAPYAPGRPDRTVGREDRPPYAGREWAQPEERWRPEWAAPAEPVDRPGPRRRDEPGGRGDAGWDERALWEQEPEDDDWAQPARGKHQGKRRRAPKVAALVMSMLLACALVAAGVWWFVFRETGVPAAEYARSVCSSVRDWQQGVDGRSSALTSSIAQQQDRGAIRTAVRSYYDDLATRTDGLRTAVTGAGVVDVDGGEAYADSFAGVVGDQATAFRDLATRADRLDPNSTTVFQIELQTLLTGATTTVSKVTAALARPPAGTPTALRDALSAEPSCAPYVG